MALEPHEAIPDLPPASPQGNFRIEKARNGSPILIRDQVALSSTFNPETEAQRYWDAQDLSHINLVVWFGSGSFYHLIELKTRKPKCPVLVVEPDEIPEELILEIPSFGELHQDPLIHWSSLSEHLSLLHQFAGANCLLLSSTPYKKSLDLVWQQLVSGIREWLEINRVNRNTLTSHAPIWYRNILKNSRFPIQGIQSWQNSFQGANTLVFAAGPSLEESLDNIPLDTWDLVIAVDTTERFLRTRGIIPDFWVSTDGQYWNSRHLERAPEPRHGLLTDVCASPRVTRLWPEKTFYATSFNPISADIFGDDLGKLRSGGSVATTAWEWARYLGSRYISFAGLDLSFPEGKTHIRGSFFEKDALAKGDRIASPTEGIWQMYLSGKLRPAESFQGEKIRTDLRMLIYKRWFEYVLADPEAPTTLNLNPRALFIKGMKTGLPPAGTKIRSKKRDLQTPLSFSPRCWQNLLNSWVEKYQEMEKEGFFSKEKIHAPEDILHTIQAFFPSLGWPGEKEAPEVWKNEMQDLKEFLQAVSPRKTRV
jgi:hypothetical protein